MTNYRDYLIIGDKSSLVSFFSELLPSDMREAFNSCSRSNPKTEMVYSEECAISSENGVLTLASDLIPKGIKLTAAENNYDWTKSNCEMVLFLFPFPINTDSNFENLNRIPDFIKSTASPMRFRIVTYQRIRTAYTDIDTPEKNLQTAINEINRKLKELEVENIVDVVNFQKGGSAEILFSGGDSMITGIAGFMKKSIITNAANLSYELDYNLDFALMDIYEIMADEEIAKFTLFEKLKKNQYILTVYLDLFIESDNWKKLCEKVTYIYVSFVEPICFWDIEKDKADFIDRFTKYAKKIISENIPYKKCPNKLMEYERYCAESKMDINFRKNVQGFINNNIRQFVLSEIKKKMMIFKVGE